MVPSATIVDHALESCIKSKLLKHPDCRSPTDVYGHSVNVVKAPYIRSARDWVCHVAAHILRLGRSVHEQGLPNLLYAEESTKGCGGRCYNHGSVLG